MIFISLLYSILLLALTFMTLGQDVYQPCGPVLCYLRCKRRLDCISYVFSELQLSCRPRVNLCNINKTNPMPPKPGNTNKTDKNTSKKKIPVWEAAAVRDFHKYVKEGSLDDVRALFFVDMVNVNCLFEDGITAVMAAAIYKREDIFYFLLKKKCDLRAVDMNRRTVLHHACVGGSMYIVKTLLDTRILHINYRAKYGASPLKYAVKYAHRKIVNLLISRGADYENLDEENNILHYACSKGNLFIVKDVLTRKLVDINSRGRIGRTPLMIAARRGHMEVFNLLFNRGADSLKTDKFNNTILHLTCKEGNKAMVYHILTLKTLPIDSREHRGRTPLITAVKFAQKSIVDLLVRNGADVNTVDDNNFNVLHYACFNAPVDTVKYVLWLNVLDIESRGLMGSTPLMCAVKGGRPNVVRLLVEKGADANTVDELNNNIFQMACKYKNLDMVQYTLSLNVSYLECRGQLGRTPLMLTIIHNDITVVKFLVTQGANTTKSDDLGYNILHIAASVGKLELVKYLVSLKELRGFQQRQDKDGNTPVQVAEMEGQCDIVTFLKRLDI